MARGIEKTDLARENQRRLDKIEVRQIVIEDMLDRILKVGVANYEQGQEIMARLDDLDAEVAKLEASVEANTGETSAIVEVINGVKALYDAAVVDLAAARAENDPARIDAAIERIRGISAKVDADTLAEKALKGPTAEPPAE